MHNDLIPHLNDAYLVGQTAVAALAPQLLRPLDKALSLVLDHHVIIYPPSKLHSNWLAGVDSQDPESDRHYTVAHEDGRYTCTCPCFIKRTYTHRGRVYCKHILATQLYIKAIKAREESVPYNAPFQAQLINDFEARNQVQLVRA